MRVLSVSGQDIRLTGQKMKIEKFDYDSLHSTPWHKHASGQLYWLNHGILVIETTSVQWTVTPGSLGWFPADVSHRAWVPAGVKGQSLYLEPASCPPFPAHPGVYGADAFVMAILERLCREGDFSSPAEYQRHLLKLLGFEIAGAPDLPLQLTLPVDRRARNVANELLKNPACALDQTQLAKQWGLSVRSLSRLFTQQTGLSFSQWRQQAKVVTSLQWVLAGLPVSEVALRSGYSNVSAYIDVFRQRFGKTPGQLQNALIRTETRQKPSG